MLFGDHLEKQFKRTISDFDPLPIENILLHLRHRSLVRHTRSQRLKIVLQAVIIYWITTLFLNSKSLLISIAIIGAAISFVPFAIFEHLEIYQIIVLIILLWALFNFRALERNITKLLIDFCDFFLLGFITEKAIRIYTTATKIT